MGTFVEYFKWCRWYHSPMYILSVALLSILNKRCLTSHSSFDSKPLLLHKILHRRPNSIGPHWIPWCPCAVQSFDPFSQVENILQSSVGVPCSGIVRALLLLVGSYWRSRKQTLSAHVHHHNIKTVVPFTNSHIIVIIWVINRAKNNSTTRVTTKHRDIFTHSKKTSTSICFTKASKGCQKTVHWQMETIFTDCNLLPF